jgi:hypothetical protein
MHKVLEIRINNLGVFYLVGVGESHEMTPVVQCRLRVDPVLHHAVRVTCLSFQTLPGRDEQHSQHQPLPSVQE